MEKGNQHWIDDARSVTHCLGVDWNKLGHSTVILKPIIGLDWITALRAPQIRAILEQDALQLSLFDQQDKAELPPTGGSSAL